MTWRNTANLSKLAVSHLFCAHILRYWFPCVILSLAFKKSLWQKWCCLFPNKYASICIYLKYNEHMCLKLKWNVGEGHENTYTSSHCKVSLIMFAKLWSLGELPISVPAGNPASSWLVRQCQVIQKWRMRLGSMWHKYRDPISVI